VVEEGSRKGEFDLKLVRVCIDRRRWGNQISGTGRGATRTGEGARFDDNQSVRVRLACAETASKWSVGTGWKVLATSSGNEYLVSLYLGIDLLPQGEEVRWRREKFAFEYLERRANLDQKHWRWV
jgi:hypothetical protein